MLIKEKLIILELFYLYVVLNLDILIYVVNGALWWTRTTDPRFRKPMLYPAELRAQKIIIEYIYSMNLIFKKKFFTNY